MPLFTDSYLADTRHLSTIQHGAYILMLMTAWRSPDCALPNDDVYLSRITGMDKRTWGNNKAILLSFWKLNDQQKWTQGRLMDERNYVEQVRNKNSAAGRASALKRLNRASTTVQPDLNVNPTPTPTPTPTPINNTDSTVSNVNEGGGDFRRVFDLGCELFPNLVTQTTSPIHSWLSEGCSVDLDILPEIRRMAGKKPRGWGFFTQSIADAKASRERPMPTGSPQQRYTTTPKFDQQAIINKVFSVDHEPE